MNGLSGYGRQAGVTLVVGLVMLLLFTLMISSTFVLSTTNLKAVGNMQSHDEAQAAANAAVELVIRSPFTNDPAAAAESINMDMNNDGVTDYTVSIATPVCIQKDEVPAVVTGYESGVRAGIVTPNSQWNTLWDISATVTDPVSGASVRVRSGIKVLLSESQKNAVCS
ncbi:hypothetical protein SAMN04244579_00119 [Azotobacter beijerinckii]|uniref:PilX N-terminal n=1 Tax=Azotobacter beijerinckii TaxID=170623 RepID=A0A1H6Q2N6_9GAMM|nr:hypothetical protein [Azotobacter beijerinckii]SEI38109.1 hypothetical protein SAMN04244579_00119 [Azotobacter beijerinckii]